MSEGVREAGRAGDGLLIWHTGLRILERESEESPESSNGEKPILVV